MALLCVDSGNTRIKAGIFKGQKMLYADVIPFPLTDTFKATLQTFGIDRIVVSDVSGKEKNFASFFHQQGACFFINSNTPLPFVVEKYQRKELGSDRLVALAGAQQLFPDIPVLIINLGTCITIDVLSQEAVFLGGYISPGINTRLKAMNTETKNLPLVMVSENAQTIGNNTRDCMNLGTMYGILYELLGHMKYYKQKFDALKIVISGGGMNKFFERQLKNSIFAENIFFEKNLTLLGLHSLALYNDYFIQKKK